MVKIKLDKIHGLKKGTSRGQIHELKCIYTNIRSIFNMCKRQELEYILYNENIDILGLSETWATENMEDSEMSFKGYVMFRKDRHSIRDANSGGVALYIRENLNPFEIDKLNKEKNESIWCGIKNDDNQTITIGVCYRSESADKKENDSLFSNIRMASKGPVLIMGDFNYRGINWTEYEASGEGSDFLKVIDDCYLEQHVKESTRGKNVLDLILTTELNMVQNVNILAPIANGDHNVLSWDLCCKTPNKSKNKIVYDYNKGNYCEINNCLIQTDWSMILGIEVEQMWDKFLTYILQLRDKYIPLKRNNNDGIKRPLWLTNKVLKVIKKKKRLWKKSKESGNLEDMELFKKARIQVITEVKAAKAHFEHKLAENIKEDPKSFYAYARSKQCTKENIGMMLKDNNNKTTDKQEICNILNEYFTSTFTSELKGNIPEVKVLFNGDQVDMLSTLTVTEELVLKHFKSLKKIKHLESMT